MRRCRSCGRDLPIDDFGVMGRGRRYDCKYCIALRRTEAKVCVECGESKPPDDFEEYRPGLRRGSCRQCLAERRKRRDPDGNKRAWAKLKSDPERKQAERERKRAYDRRPERVVHEKARNRARMDQIVANNRKWRAENRERDRALKRKHARLRRLDPSAREWSNVLVEDPCPYCGGPSTGVDHVQPLALGGANDESNIVGACFDCNRRKRSTPLLLFLLSEGVDR